ncbi:MAG: hypothetical protein GXP38_00805 [Chloroflexi bacterium]|nr:hypothetical protein [Chloroflexota bacterium]
MKLKNLRGPLKVGLIAASIGILFAVIGIFRGVVPPRAASILMAILISGGSWGIVAWAIATAAYDVEHDISEIDLENTPEHPTS